MSDFPEGRIVRRGGCERKKGVKNSHAGVRSGEAGGVKPIRCARRGAVPRLQSHRKVGSEGEWRADVPTRCCTCTAHCGIWRIAIRSAWRCCIGTSCCRRKRRRRGGCVRARAGRRVRSRRRRRICASTSRIRASVGAIGRASCAAFGTAGSRAGETRSRGEERRGGAERRKQTIAEQRNKGKRNKGNKETVDQ